jgi:serine/threonine protein kinase
LNESPKISNHNVWSIGVIAYQLCTLILPFKGRDSEDLRWKILNNPHDPIPDKLYSDELKDLINLLLTKDPEQRPSIQELIKFPIIRDAIDSLLNEFEGKIYFDLKKSLIK